MKDKLYFDNYYHVFNRGNNGESIFFEKKNYTYFMDLFKKYLLPLADIYAFCLLKNHFHFLIKIKSEKEIFEYIEKNNKKNFKKTNYDNESGLNFITQHFSNFFNAYSKSINKAYERTGSLFEKPFKRKLIDKDSYLINLIYYIHNNPVKHGLVEKITDYPYNSYNILLSENVSNLQKRIVLELFSGIENFKNYHLKNNDFTEIENLIIE